VVQNGPCADSTAFVSPTSMLNVWQRSSPGIAREIAAPQRGRLAAQWSKSAFDGVDDITPLAIAHIMPAHLNLSKSPLAVSPYSLDYHL
jgi:hypothetical protein